VGTEGRRLEIVMKRLSWSEQLKK